MQTHPLTDFSLYTAAYWRSAELPKTYFDNAGCSSGNGYCVSEAGEYGIEGNTSRLFFGKHFMENAVDVAVKAKRP